MQHRDVVKAAKELNKLAGCKIKVVAIKGNDLQKLVKETVPTLTDFDFSTLSPEALDVLDELKCEMPEYEEPEEVELMEDDKPEMELLEDEVTDAELIGDTELEPDNDDEPGALEDIDGDLDEIEAIVELEEKQVKKTNVLPIKKEGSSQEELIAAATDLIDVLNYDPEDIKKFEKLSFFKMVKELQKMADVINEPYDEGEEVVVPDDKPEDFKPVTLKVFEANGIKVKWHETEEKVEKEQDKEKPEPKAKVQDKQDKPEVKPASKKKESGKSDKRKEAKNEMVNTVKKYLEKGKFTRKEIIEKVNADLPHLNPSTIGTLVSDSKNPKYNKYDSLVIQDEKGILSFS